VVRGVVVVALLDGSHLTTKAAKAAEEVAKAEKEEKAAKDAMGMQRNRAFPPGGRAECAHSRTT